MKADKTYENFLEVVKVKVPHKKELVSLLMKLLFIEKEAVYRRLRGEVLFTFTEISQISKALHISLDSIVNTPPTFHKVRPCYVTLVDYLNPSESDYGMLDAFVNDIARLKKTKNSEAATATNGIPQFLYVNYLFIYRFCLFKWQYQSGSRYSKLPFKDINPSDRLLKINRDIQYYFSYVETLHCIWDRRVFEFLVNDIKYFSAINLITKEEKNALKEELMVFLKDIERLTVKGSFHENKQVYVYLSNLNIGGTHFYLSIDDEYKLSMLEWFTLTDTASTDDKAFEKMKKWMLALQRSSTLISGSDEIQRIKFFEAQKEIIQSL